MFCNFIKTNALFLARKRRSHHTQFVSYREKEVPTAPNTSAVQRLQNDKVLPAAIDQIKTVGILTTLSYRFDNIL